MSERIGFLGIFGSLDAKQGLRGGLMVCDDQGIPLEIQVATPVKPSRIQRAVHGRPLEHNVIVDLIAKPLLMSLDFHPRLVLTNHPYCLFAESRFPLFFLGDEVEVDGTENRRSTDVQPIHDALKTVVPGSAGNATPIGASGLISRIQRHFDPLEVFNRIENALDVLAEHDDRFS